MESSRHHAFVCKLIISRRSVLAHCNLYLGTLRSDKMICSTQVRDLTPNSLDQATKSFETSAKHLLEYY